MNTIYSRHADRLIAQGHTVDLVNMADVREGDRVIVDVAQGMKPLIGIRPVLELTTDNGRPTVRHAGRSRYDHYYTAPQVYVVRD